jgi:hypothetical protein
MGASSLKSKAATRDMQPSSLSSQLQQLLCSPHFQRVSGRQLAAAEMAFGFRFAALPGSWPCLQSLGDLIGLPRYLLQHHCRAHHATDVPVPVKRHTIEQTNGNLQ